MYICKTWLFSLLTLQYNLYEISLQLTLICVLMILFYRSITRDDLQEYIKAHYKGPRVVLAAAGGKYNTFPSSSMSLTAETVQTYVYKAVILFGVGPRP